jgi:hypothetical protein
VSSAAAEEDRARTRILGPRSKESLGLLTTLKTLRDVNHYIRRKQLFILFQSIVFNTNFYPVINLSKKPFTMVRVAVAGGSGRTSDPQCWIFCYSDASRLTIFHRSLPRDHRRSTRDKETSSYYFEQEGEEYSWNIYSRFCASPLMHCTYRKLQPRPLKDPEYSGRL